MIPLRAVLWDIDGTLVDSEPNHVRSFLAVCRSLGFPLTDEQGASFTGISLEDIYAWMQANGGVALTLEELKARITGDFIANIHLVQPRQGSVDLVRRFAALGLRQACVSNAERNITQANLGVLGRAELEFAICRNDVSTGKPDPEGYLLAAKRLGVPPAACAVIEDSPTGARAAKAAGMLTIAWPQSPEHVFEEVDHLVEHPSEVDWRGLIKA